MDIAFTKMDYRPINYLCMSTLTADNADHDWDIVSDIRKAFQICYNTSPYITLTKISLYPLLWYA